MRVKIEKIAETIGVFSPIIILLFVCSSYLYNPENKNAGLKTGLRNESGIRDRWDEKKEIIFLDNKTKNHANTRFSYRRKSNFLQ